LYRGIGDLFLIQSIFESLGKRSPSQETSGQVVEKVLGNCVGLIGDESGGEEVRVERYEKLAGWTLFWRASRDNLDGIDGGIVECLVR
jgi:hypothetical protein